MTPSEAATLVAGLNEDSFSDAVGTRDEVVRLLRTLSAGERTLFLEELAVGAQSRLRQAVARAAQILGTNGDLPALIEQWMVSETDEFARAAIEDALSPVKRYDRRKKFLSDLDSVPRTYRYLADRLRHRVLNTMPGAGLSVTKLKDVAATISNDQQRHELLKEIDYLSTTFGRLQRALDFVDEKSPFERTHLNLTEWLRAFSSSYRVQSQELDVRIMAPESPVSMEAVPYLLETIFRNLFDNAREAVDRGGTIILRITVRHRDVRVEVSDSGLGLPESVAKVAFQMAVSTKSRRDRGRGLLEVADAMKRLGGRAEVMRDVQSYRISLMFPLAK